MIETAESPNEKRLWNSLEVCKLIVGLAVPLALLFVSHRFATRDFVRAKEDEREKREVDRRFSVWEEMAPDVNQIYSYFLYVGDWKAISPEQVIQKKRHLDDLIYSNRIFFSNDFFNTYTAFTRAAFYTFQGWKHDPKLNTVRVRDLDLNSKVEFGTCDNGDEVYTAFWAFQDASRIELNLPPVQASPRPTARPTGDEAIPCHVVK